MPGIMSRLIIIMQLKWVYYIFNSIGHFHFHYIWVWLSGWGVEDLTGSYSPPSITSS